jgi:hypothetical protein
MAVKAKRAEFKRTADVLKSARARGYIDATQLLNLAAMFAVTYAECNKSFNVVRFGKACGVEPDVVKMGEAVL